MKTPFYYQKIVKDSGVFHLDSMEEIAYNEYSRSYRIE